MTKEDIPDAIDQLAAEVHDALGDGVTYRRLVELIARSRAELAEMEDDGGLCDRDEFIEAHAGDRAAEARALNDGRV